MREVPVVMVIYFLVIWAGCMVYWVRNALKGYDPNRGALSRFHITDIWAVILGLIPTFLLLGYFYNPKRETPATFQEGLFTAVVFFSQITGIVVGKIQHTPRRGSSRMGALEHAAVYLTGALLGLGALGGVCLVAIAVGISLALIWSILLFLYALLTEETVIGIPVLFAVLGGIWYGFLSVRGTRRKKVEMRVPRKRTIIAKRESNQAPDQME